MKNEIRLGALLSYLQMGMGIIVGLVYTPIMIRLLGQNEYGLYNTVSSTIAMLSILSLGFNSSYIRYFSIYIKRNDQEAIYRLNGLFLIIFSIIGMIALICGLYLAFHLNLIFADGLTSQEYVIAKSLVVLLAINMAVTFTMTVFSNIISAHENFVFLKMMGMLKTVASPLITLPLLLMGYRSIAMVAVTLIISVIVDASYVFYVLFKLKNRFIFNGFERGLFKSLFSYTIFIAINMIIDQINWNVDKILLGRFRGTNEVAIYSVGFSLYHYYQMFSTAISGVFTPRIHKIINETKDNTKSLHIQLTEIFTKVGRIQFVILGLVASGLLFFGYEFITLYWAGEAYGNAYGVMILLIFPASVALIQNLGIEIQRALNKHQFRSYVYLVMAIVNLGLSIYLCQLYGAIGSAIGTACSLVIANGFIMNIYYHKRCYINILFFWKNIGRLSVGLVFPSILGCILQRYVLNENIVIFFLSCLIYVVVYCISMWTFGMNQYEKELVHKIVKRV